MVALNEYDLRVYEDSTTNRMHESLKLFKEICNSQWFNDTPIILFLNKKDQFEVKIKQVDLSCCFPEYRGGKDYNQAITFIKERFLSLNENPNKPIYTHVTCATDRNCILFVFDSGMNGSSLNITHNSSSERYPSSQFAATCVNSTVQITSLLIGDCSSPVF